jgi:hypothetical protein
MIDLEGWFDEGTDQVMLFSTNNLELLDLAEAAARHLSS